MEPPKPVEPLFAILTVCLDPGAKPADDRDAYNQLKGKLGLSGTDIDDAYGAMPVIKAMPWMADQLPENSYLILVSQRATLALVKAEPKHPNLVGWHHAAMVHSGQGPQPMSAEDVAKIMQHRKPKGPRP